MTKQPEDSSDETASEAVIVSFIVRVWSEDPASETEQKIWYGHITPVPDGVRHYFTNFDEIPAFMRDYLKSTK